jgi:hypothetical protein
VLSYISDNKEIIMISKTQYRRLNKMINEGNTLKDASARAGIDPKTARKYLMEGDPFLPPISFYSNNFIQQLNKLQRLGISINC